MSNYSSIVTWIYCALYGTVSLFTSIICAIHTKSEYSKLQTKDTDIHDIVHLHRKNVSADTSDRIKSDIDTNANLHTMTSCQTCVWFLKHWGKLIYKKKKVYFSILPHIFDQATDVGVILQYHWYMKNDPHMQSNINIKYWFYLSISILCIHRIVSCLAVWMNTRNLCNVLLQSLDLLIMRCIWTNYTLNTTERSTLQRLLEIIEATFESMPQLVLSMVFLLQTQQFDTIITLSVIISMWSLTSRVVSDDKALVNEDWQHLGVGYLTRVSLRFLEISSRVSLYALLWARLGGLVTFIIVAFESLFLVTICISIHSVIPMGNLMYFVCDTGDVGKRFTRSRSAKLYKMWIAYKLISSYIYLLLITINRRSLGHGLMIYAWVAHFIWPCCGYCLLTRDDDIWSDVSIFRSNDVESTGKSKELQFSASRDINVLYTTGRFIEVVELAAVGCKAMSVHDYCVIAFSIVNAKRLELIDETMANHLINQLNHDTLRFKQAIADHFRKIIVMSNYIGFGSELNNMDILRVLETGYEVQYAIDYYLVIKWLNCGVNVNEKDSEQRITNEYIQQLIASLGNVDSMKFDLYPIVVLLNDDETCSYHELHRKDIIALMIENKSIPIKSIDDYVLVYWFIRNHYKYNKERRDSLISSLPDLLSLPDMKLNEYVYTAKAKAKLERVKSKLLNPDQEENDESDDMDTDHETSKQQNVSIDLHRTFEEQTNTLVSDVGRMEDTIQKMQATADDVFGK
eukprot:189892_1